AAGKTAMAHFATTGKADTTALTDRVGREVVVQHKRVFALAFEGVDDLRIAQRTEGCRDQGLGFTAGKQGGTVNLGQYANLDADGTHGLAVATIDAGFATDDAAANNFLFELLEGAFDVVGSDAGLITDKRFNGGRTGAVDSADAGLLVGGAVGSVERRTSLGLEGFCQVQVFSRSLPVPARLAALAHQLVDYQNRRLHFL